MIGWMFKGLKSYKEDVSLNLKDQSFKLANQTRSIKDVTTSVKSHADKI